MVKTRIFIFSFLLIFLNGCGGVQDNTSEPLPAINTDSNAVAESEPQETATEVEPPETVIEAEPPETVIEWTPANIWEYGIEIQVPTTVRVLDQRENGGVLSFVAEDKSWMLIISAIDVDLYSAENLITDTSIREALKSGYEESNEGLSYEIDNTTKIGGVDALHIKYKYTRSDGLDAVDEHVVFSKTYTQSGQVFDMLFHTADFSDETLEMLAKMKASITLT